MTGAHVDLVDEIEMGDDPTALYRLYDADGALLYVGITVAPGRRMTSHAVEQPWWPEVARKTMAWHPTRQEAGDAETKAINTERPKYNKQMTSNASSGAPGYAADMDLIERYNRGQLVQVLPNTWMRKFTPENPFPSSATPSPETKRAVRERRLKAEAAAAQLRES